VTLQAAGASVVGYDPEGENSARLLLPGVIFASAYAFLQGASALPVLTEWDEFHALDPARNRPTPAKRVVVDLRDIYPNGTMRSLCFRYVGVGGRVTVKGGDERRVVIWVLRAERMDASCALERKTEEDQCGSRYTGWVMWV
jgi:UDP-glucose/GDP-mannose dehydrogenase family, UDP binding domain